MLSDIAAELESGGRTLVLIHGNADPDALSSAFAVSRAFPDVEICAPGGLDRVSKILASRLDIEVRERDIDPEDERVLVLDTSGPDQIPLQLDYSDSIVIDHHARNSAWNGARIYLCDDTKASCAEIVYELLKAAQKDIDRDVALALMVGILTDTGSFKYARPGSLIAFAELMERHGTHVDEAIELVSLDVDPSEKISQLRGAQRLKYWKVGDRIVAISQGSAFEASVCKALLHLGADIAFVGSQRDETFRISARATQDVVRRGVHLGRLLNGVGSETSNGGGGHPGAAGISGVGDVEAMLNISAENAIKRLRKIGREGSSSGDR
ncbi:MAG: DHH family phosphoesterase [Methanobacteriota archaeon]|nr:MAG: DHH family phosphoesterase [Euryarchaeota archaeon]